MTHSGDWLQHFHEGKYSATLLCRDESSRARDALPSLVLLDPSVYKAFAVDVWFTFFHAFHTEDSRNNGGISIHLNADLFVDGLGRLITGIFDAGEKSGFIGHGAVDFNRDEGAAQHLIKRFRVLEFDGVSPGGFEGKHAAAFVAAIALA